MGEPSGAKETAWAEAGGPASKEGESASEVGEQGSGAEAGKVLAPTREVAVREDSGDKTKNEGEGKGGGKRPEDVATAGTGDADK